MKKTILLSLLIILLVQLTSALNIFTESFESGSLAGWTLSSASGANNWTSSTTDPHTGTWHANANPRSTTEPAAVLQKAISTSEYQNITFSYYKRLIGIDAGDEFQVEWFNGTTWEILESTGGASANDASYLYREFNLSIQANDNQNFQIKFECTAGATTEHCRVDNVNITGNLMPDTSPPSTSLLSPLNGSTTSTNLTYFNAHFTDNRNATNTTLYIWNSTTLIGTNFTVLGNSSISINLSFTLPKGGTYFWNYLTYDSSTNSAFNLTNFTLIFNPPETTPPNITSLTETPTGPSTYTQNAKYEFNATITDNTAISSVIIEFNGINYTATNLTNSLFNFTISNLAAGIYSYYWRANDTLNNINVTETFTYTINKAQSQLNLTLNNTEGNITIVQGTSIYINASLISGDQSNIQLYKNGTLINNGTSPISNLTLFDIAGLYNITIIYPSSQNYTESSKTYFVNVTPQSDLAPPNITSLIPVQNSQFNLSQVIEISANINDESSINSVVANITFPNSTIYLLQLSLSINNKYNNSFTIPSNLIGRYNITFIANDSLNNINSTEKTFLIANDVIAPSLTLIHPQNISYNTNSLQINFTVSDTNLQSCWYTTNSGQTNTSLTNCQNTSYTAAQGSTTLKLYANDSSNNINSSSVTFFVDSIIPLISYTSPTESNNSLIKTRNIVINISATDTNLANITIFLLNSTSLVNQTTITSNNNFINITNLPDGIYYFNATATDILNNKNSTETKTIILDSTSPQITSLVENPANGSSYALNAKYEFNATITDNTAISSVIIEFNGINYTATNLTNSLFNFTISNLGAGIYSYYWRANDTLNNINVTETFTYTINKAQGSISLLLNNTASNITLSYPSQVNASTTSSTNQIIQLLRNNIDITSQNHLFQNLQSNLYNFTAIAQENQNYTQEIITRFADLQKGIPQGTISLSPSNSIIYGTQTTISASESNQGDADIFYTLTRDNIITTNPETLILGAGTYNYTFNATESQNWTSTILDTKLLAINKSSSKVYTYINNSRSNITVQLGNTLQINSTLINGTFGSLNLTQNFLQLNFSTSNNLTYTQTFNTIGNFLINTSYAENQNFSSDSESWFVTVIDSLYPLISIIQPQNISYNTLPLQLNYSVSDTNLQSCWYTTNTSIICGNNISITAEQGSNTWKIYANDSAGNTNSSSVTFFVDSIIPLISYTTPTNQNNSILAQNSIFINITITETNFANITFSLHNSTSPVNQTTFTSQITIINFSSLQDGIYFYNVTIKDTLNNQNTTETRTITIDTLAPSLSIISPQNITYFNTSILINISSNGNTIWFFNTTANETYTSPVYRTLDGSNTIIAYANDSAGNINSSSITFYATEIALNCEVGGPYQQGALILVQGNLSNKTSPLNAQEINLTIYKNNLINISKILTTSNDGSFETSITNLSIGDYLLNATTSYLQSNRSCTDNFQIGSQASLIISKIASIHNTTNETIYYNITLKLTNNGGSDTLNTNITDSDSGSSPYLIGTLSPSSNYQISYLKNFTRQSSTTYYETSIATALGIDSYSNSLLATNSTQINLTIPPTQVGKQIIITKNILYISENSLNITYNITSTLFNSGDEDLTNINYIDTDISDIATQLNLTKSSSQTLSNTKTIAKAASNTQYEFALGTATISSLNFYSNRPKINIPGYGGPADVIVYAPSSLNPSASFDSIIEIKNVNPDIGQDFPIAYWITNNEETQNYSSGQKTIYVGANSSLNTTITLTSPATAGIYKLKAQATWAGGSASAFDSFEVSSATTQQPPSSEGGSSSSSAPIISPPTKKPIPEQEEKTEEKQKETEIICNSPYMRHGLECCLDQNNNNICDKDEKSTPEEPKKQNFLTTITGFFIKNTPDIKTINKFIILLIWLILAIALILLVIYLKKKKQKHINRLTHLKGIKVYTSEGIEIGRIKEIFIENHKIHSIQIKLSKKLRKNKKLKAKGITIKYKHVQNIQQIAIINEKILEEIK